MASILYNNTTVITLVWVCGIIGTIGNISVIIKIFKVGKRSSKIMSKLIRKYPTGRVKNSSRSSIFLKLIFNLAISDLIGCIYLLIIAGADIHYRFLNLGDYSSNVSSTFNYTLIYATWMHSPPCYIARFFNFFSVGATTCLTVLIAVDRFISVFTSNSMTLRLRTKRLQILIYSSWACGICSAVIGTVFAYITLNLKDQFTNYFYHNLCTLDNIENEYIRIFLTGLVLAGVGAYGAAACCYIAIAYKIRCSKNTSKLPKSSRIDQRIAKKILIITATVVFSNLAAWIPSLAISLLATLRFYLLYTNGAFKIAMIVASLSIQINCSINPLVFLLSMRKS
ncbi:G-protein coupled receptor GRL101-like protein [Trichoplax sp. H2]|nr:G-protein coupled receptor GRL101-like protein [Trichoplax sp. H2]|eukprot:RDD39582.1 G-protein coupled receptor GRL101-like protein [Trichoplax sp. H2]